MTELVALTEPRSPGAEAYRILRTNLALPDPGGPATALLLTSPGPDEGKSTVIANLAVVLAQSEREVIVADCDLRRPMQHEIFGLTSVNGVSSVLAGDDGEELPLAATSVEGLKVMTSGELPPSPADLLGGTRMARLVERLKGECDVVLIDAPPVVAVTDAAVIAPRTDGVVLVLASGKSRRDQTAQARELLDRAGGTVLGVVLTGVQPEAVPYGKY